MILRLNLGAGGVTPAGWLNVDRTFPDGQTAPILAWDLTEVPWPFDPSSIDYAVAHHFLDLIGTEDLDGVLDEIARILKPGGVLRISLFDIRKATEAAERSDRAWFVERDAPDVDLMRQFRWIIYLNGARRWLSTPFLLGLVLEAHGFTSYKVGFGETICADKAICDLDSRPDESYFLEAVRA